MDEDWSCNLFSTLPMHFTHVHILYGAVHSNVVSDSGAKVTLVYVNRFSGQIVHGQLDTLQTSDRILSVSQCTNLKLA